MREERLPVASRKSAKRGNGRKRMGIKKEHWLLGMSQHAFIRRGGSSSTSSVLARTASRNHMQVHPHSAVTHVSSEEASNKW